MKETVNVNIASQAFTLDDDAYAVLRRYLDDIRRRLPQEDNNTMEDVEARIADIFRERLSSPMMVVSLASVQYAMEQLGQPDDFGECPSDRTGGCTGEQIGEQIGEPEPAPRKLYRSRSDRAIAGICGGLADYLRVDPLVIRLLTLFLILFGGPLDLDLHHSLAGRSRRAAKHQHP